MISPLNFLASLTARDDFPEAVGPKITRIFGLVEEEMPVIDI